MRIESLQSAVKWSAATMVIFGILAGPAIADTWRLATKLPAESPEGQLHQKFADLVAGYTNGSLDIQIYPSEQLGDAQSVLEQVSGGIIDIFSDDVTYLDKWNPAISWISAPFLFDSRDHWSCFLSNDYFQDVLSSATEASNITVIGDVGPVIRGPYRVIVSVDPINGLSDVEDLKLRIWDNQLIVDVWSALGAEVRVLGWTDVYQSIQTGIVASVTSPAALVESMKFTEVAPHVARTDEFNQALAYMINVDSWGSITEEEQAAVLRAYEEVGAISQDSIGSIATESLARLQDAGVTYTELDTGPFVERAAGIYDELSSEGRIPDGFLKAVASARSDCS